MNTERTIRCSVKHCYYHKNETECTADHINVGNPTACNCGETQCSTFRYHDINPDKK